MELDLACGIFDLKNEASEQAAERSLVHTGPVSGQGATYGFPELELQASDRTQRFSFILPSWKTQPLMTRRAAMRRTPPPAS